MSDAELIKQARKRAELRRKIRGEPDRIADLLDALCDSIERLSGCHGSTSGFSGS